MIIGASPVNLASERSRHALRRLGLWLVLLGILLWLLKN